MLLSFKRFTLERQLFNSVVPQQEVAEIFEGIEHLLSAGDNVLLGKQKAVAPRVS